MSERIEKLKPNVDRNLAKKSEQKCLQIFLTSAFPQKFFTEKVTLRARMKVISHFIVWGCNLLSAMNKWKLDSWLHFSRICKNLKLVTFVVEGLTVIDYNLLTESRYSWSYESSETPFLYHPMFFELTSLAWTAQVSVTDWPCLTSFAGFSAWKYLTFFLRR